METSAHCQLKSRQRRPSSLSRNPEHAAKNVMVLYGSSSISVSRLSNCYIVRITGGFNRLLEPRFLIAMTCVSPASNTGRSEVSSDARRVKEGGVCNLEREVVADRQSHVPHSPFG
jgi:hypothetical protein